MAKVIFCSPTRLDEFRFFRFFKNHEDGHLYYDRLGTIFSLWTGRNEQLKLVVNGLRFPDRLIIYLCKLKRVDLIVLQHNVHVPKYSNVEKIRKIKNNFWKYTVWLVFCVLFALIFLKTVKRGQKNSFVCFYFTEEFGSKVRNIGSGFQLRQCSWPDMRHFGSASHVEIKGHISYFFIDEPFETTLGISSVDLLRKALGQVPASEKLVVKIHPRSDSDKYDDFLDRLEVTNAFPETIDFIFTYKSNLGSFFKARRQKYMYSAKEADFVPVDDSNNHMSGSSNYISECMELFQ